MKSGEIPSEVEKVGNLFRKPRIDLGQRVVNKQSGDLKNNGDVEDNEAFLQEEIVKTPTNSPNCTDGSPIKQASSSNEQAFEIVFDDDNSNFMEDFVYKKQTPVYSQNSLQENDEPIAVEKDHHKLITVEKNEEPISVEKNEEPITVEKDHHKSNAVEKNEESIAVEKHHEPIAVEKKLTNEMKAMEIRKDSYDIALDFFCPKITAVYVNEAAKICEQMFVVDSDLKFFNNYVNMMRDPKSYQMKVTRVFRLDSLHPSQRGIDYLKNNTLLMHGVHFQNLFCLLKNGFSNLNGASSKRMYFGRGFYFSDCSTKAFNFSSQRNAYNFERKADNGECQPGIDDFGYILMCNVALGHGIYFSYPTKFNDKPFTNGDSLKTVSKYQAKEKLELHFPITKKDGSQAITLPYGGFHHDQEEVYENPKSTNFADYCVFDPNQIEMQWLLEVQRIT